MATQIAELTGIYNRAKEQTIRTLIKEKLITKAIGEEWMKTHAFILGENSWFGDMWEKLQGKTEEDKWSVHVITLPKGKEEDESGTNREGTNEPESSDMARFTPPT